MARKSRRGDLVMMKQPTHYGFGVRPMTIAEFCELPMSGLLKLAVRDMQTFEGRGGKIDMRDWLTTAEQGPCIACMAGSVLSCTLRQDSINTCCLEPWWECIDAIDEMRQGNFGAAADDLGIHLSLGQEEALNSARHLVKFSWRPDGSLRSTDEAYLQAAEILESVGL